jgi:LacI family transcriptional regulator
MALTLEDIARLSGVSRSTVSRVINDEPNVREGTRQKVLDVIHDINFQPNLAARGLAVGKTGVIGLLIPTTVAAIFTEPFFPLLIQGVSTACNACDYSMMLWLAEPEYERRTITRILYSGLVDGVIVSSAQINDTIIQSLADNNVPFVLIGRHPTIEHYSYVDVDNRVSAYQAVMHLLRLGRQRVAMITGPQNTVPGIERYKGYQDALRERSLHLDPDLIIMGDFTEACGYAGMQRLLPHRPDAVFAASDAMALGVIRAAREAGLQLPQDLAVIGFDDIPQASQAMPTLTTIRQTIQRLGTTAAETLIDMIETSAEPPRHLILPTELIIRESCGFNL